MTRDQLAAWCATVTDPTTSEEPVPTIREAHDTYQAEKAAAKQRFTEAIVEARKTMTLREIAEELGVTVQRASQLSKGE